MMKKFLHGLMMMGAAVVISAGVSSTAADAASIAGSTCTVDYANQKIDFLGTLADTKIYVAKATVTQKKKFPKDKESTEMVTTVKNAAATEYDLAAKKATIDISSFGVTKDVYLSIWGNVSTEPILIKLPAATTKMKAVVDATDSTVAIQDITDKTNPVEISGTEFCTTNGAWKAYTVSGTKATTAKTTGVKLTDYAQLGATLRFRVTASAAVKLPAAATTIGTDADGKEVKAFVGTGNFSSNEIKAKIAKTANGPKATIDYNTRTVTVPTTCEYRSSQATVLAATYTSAAAQATPDAKGNLPKTVKLSVDTLFAKVQGVAKETEFDIRTAATDKKPASKITEYKLPLVGTITAQATVNNKTTAFAVANNPTTYDVTNSSIKDANVTVTKLVLNSKTMAGTMTIKNDSADGYQFVVSDIQDATKISALTLPAADAKVTATVAAGKTAGIKVKSGQYVFVRKAANVKAQVWSTPYVYYGQVMNTKE